MASSKSRFTVAKLDAGMAILLTADHHLIEFPSLLLPPNIAAGSIIDLAVAQNTTKEEEECRAFEKLQEEIRTLFGVHAPSTPNLSVRNTTQTSVVLAWDLLDLATAEMRSMSLYKNGSKLGKIPNATTTTTKLSGLALDTDYTFQLVLKTTAGTQSSNALKIKTHKMTNLSGLNVCVGHIRDADRASLEEALRRIGAKPPHEQVRIDTTHFVTDRGMGDEFVKAQQLNIPVVVPDFVEACEREGRLVRVGEWYLDSDPSKRQKRPATVAPVTTTVTAGANSTTAEDESSTPIKAVEGNKTKEDSTVAEAVVEKVQEAAGQVKAGAVAVQQSLAEGADQLAQKVGLKDTTEGTAATEETKSTSETPTETVEEHVLSPAEAAPTEATDQAPAAPTREEKGKGKAIVPQADAFPPSMSRPAATEDEFESVSLS